MLRLRTPEAVSIYAGGVRRAVLCVRNQAATGIPVKRRGSIAELGQSSAQGAHCGVSAPRTSDYSVCMCMCRERLRRIYGGGVYRGTRPGSEGSTREGYVQCPCVGGGVRQMGSSLTTGHANLEAIVVRAVAGGHQGLRGRYARARGCGMHATCVCVALLGKEPLDVGAPLGGKSGCWGRGQPECGVGKERCEW